MTIYFPLSLAASALEKIKDVEARTGVRFAVSRGICDLGAVRSAIVRFSGTSLWVRMPFVYPFSCGSLRNEFPGQYHVAEDVDWIWLGRDLDAFVEYVEEYLARHQPERIDVLFFDRMTGRILQDEGTGEIEARLQRGILNYNFPQWQAACAAMLEAEEKDWGPLAPNTVDSLPALAPHLDKYVRTAPRLILDLGCGVGQTARSLALRYPRAQVYGIDASEAAIAVARHHFRMDNLQFLVGGIGGRLPFHDATVDLAVSVNALMYGENQTATARELFRVMHGQGVLLHYSRMLESHMFWDFPLSFAGPTIFQINAADWVSAGEQRGFNTIVKASPAMLPNHPGFFHPSKASVFAEAFSTGIAAEKAGGAQVYKPWHSHALMVHAAFLKRSSAGLESAAYLDRLDRALLKAGECNPHLMDAAILGWHASFASLDVCPEALDFLRLNLPDSGETIFTVLSETPE